MGKTVVVIIFILLSLACGALGWEVMRQQSEKQNLETRISDLEVKLAAVSVPAQQPEKKFATEEMLDDLGSRMQSLEDRNQELLGTVQELSATLAELKKSGAAGKSSGDLDLTNLPEEQKKALQELVKEEAKAQDLKRANMLKGMVMQRINTELNKVSGQLELTPVQKEDVSSLAKKVVDKGFKAGMEAFEKQEWDKLRENMREIIEEMDTELKQILDPDQIQKLKELDPDGFGRREKQREENR
jgi:uncharacterized coiled-coil protein SlyX